MQIPTKLGAQCPDCPFNGRMYSEPQHLDRERVVLGQSPGVDGVSGEAGYVLRLALGDTPHGVLNAVQCFPGLRPNKKELEQARKCCEPMVRRLIAGKDVLALGGDAARSILQRPVSILGIRGETHDAIAGAKRVHFQVHPQYVLHAGGPSSEAGQVFLKGVREWIGGRRKAEAVIFTKEPPPQRWMPAADAPVIVDLETTGLDPYAADAAIRCIGFAWRAPNGQAVAYVTEKLTVLAQSLLRHRTNLWAHNAPFDMGWLKRFRLLRNPGAWGCTQIYAHDRWPDRGAKEDGMGDGGGYGLDNLVRDKVPFEFETKGDLLGEYKVWEAPIGVLKHYCAWDCVKELYLLEELQKVPPSPRYHTIGFPAALMFHEVSRRGIPVSKAACHREERRLERRIARCEALLAQFAEINWQSFPQVMQVLQAWDVEHPGTKTTEGAPAMDGLARAGIKHLNRGLRVQGMTTRLAQDVTRKSGAGYRLTTILRIWERLLAARKLYGTFTSEKQGGLRANTHPDGRFHPRFHLTGTTTFRLSVTRPALQTLPPRAKRAVEAPRGKILVEFDYDGAEVHWEGFLSQDPVLLDLVRKNESLHSLVSKQLGIPRPVAKTMNFLISKGGSEIALQALLDETVGWGLYSKEQCREMIRQRHALVAVYNSWGEKQLASAAKTGYVESPWGARMPVPGATGKPFGREYAEAARCAKTYPVQSAASDTMLEKLLVVRKRRCRGELWTATHDSALFCLDRATWKADARRIRKILEDPRFSWGTIQPPLRTSAKAGKSWGKLKSVKL